jgi:membrane protein DedA with SNARE-associated domain
LNEWIGALVDGIVGVMSTHGYVAVAGLVFLENLVPPIPSTVVLPPAGFLAGRGYLQFPWLLAAATGASVVASLVFYGLGRWLGDERVRHFIDRFGRWLLLRQADVDRAEGWFDRHGGVSVLVGHLLPFGRGLIAIPAGVAGMPIVTFVPFAAIGSAIWNAAMIGLGWALGWQWERVGQYVEVVGWPIALALAAAAAWFFWHRARARR